MWLRKMAKALVFRKEKEEEREIGKNYVIAQKYNKRNKVNINVPKGKNEKNHSYEMMKDDENHKIMQKKQLASQLITHYIWMLLHVST